MEKIRFNKPVDEVLVRDVKLDVPYFLTKKEAEEKAKKGEVKIVNEKTKQHT